MPSERLSRKGFTRMGLVLAAVVVVASLGACSLPLPSDGAAGPTAGTPISAADGGSAVAALASLAVKGRAPRTGYDRALFGQAWADVDRNGCDTRTICSDQVEQVAAWGA